MKAISGNGITVPSFPQIGGTAVSRPIIASITFTGVGESLTAD